MQSEPPHVSGLPVARIQWHRTQAKVAKSRIRLRVILRGPVLGCESLPGVWG